MPREYRCEKRHERGWSFYGSWSYSVNDALDREGDGGAI